MVFNTGAALLDAIGISLAWDSSKQQETRGGTSYAGLSAEQNVKNEGATKEIHVECGVGEVRIKFME